MSRSTIAKHHHHHNQGVQPEIPERRRALKTGLAGAGAIAAITAGLGVTSGQGRRWLSRSTHQLSLYG